MIEKIYYLSEIDPIALYGINNNKLNFLKKAFPLLKIVSRGEKMKVSGQENEILNFEEKLDTILNHIKLYQSISSAELEKIILGNYSKKNSNKSIENDKKNIIVYGNNGKIIRAKTPNQKKMLKQSDDNDILFAIGPAGTGKTYTAVALAVKAWKNRQIKRIILTRPAVEAGENLGFLPGDMAEKIDPYLRPLYDALEDMIPIDKLEQLKESRIIEIAPLAFMRGRTLDNAFIILDEAQNTTSLQLKMFLTRLGPSAKCIITGDETQVDLPKSQKSGLPTALKILHKISGISVVRLDGSDVVRHKLVAKIIKAYESKNKNDDSKN